MIHLLHCKKIYPELSTCALQNQIREPVHAQETVKKKMKVAAYLSPPPLFLLLTPLPTFVLVCALLLLSLATQFCLHPPLSLGVLSLSAALSFVLF